MPLGHITREEFEARRAKPPPKPKPPKPKHPCPGPPYGGVWARPTGGQWTHYACSRKARAALAKQANMLVHALMSYRVAPGDKFPIGSCAVGPHRQHIIGQIIPGERDPSLPRTRRAAARPAESDWSTPLYGRRAGSWWSYPVFRDQHPTASDRNRGCVKLVHAATQHAAGKMGISIGPGGEILFAKNGGESLRAESLADAVGRLTGWVCEARIADEGTKKKPEPYLLWRPVRIDGRRVRYRPPGAEQLELVGAP